jgi:hypothetical protein
MIVSKVAMSSISRSMSRVAGLVLVEPRLGGLDRCGRARGRERSGLKMISCWFATR